MLKRLCLLFNVHFIVKVLVRNKDGEKRQVLTLLLQEKLNPADHNREIFIQVLKYVFFYNFIWFLHIKKGIWKMEDQICNYLFILQINKVCIFNTCLNNEYGLSFYRMWRNILFRLLTNKIQCCFIPFV